MIKVGSTKAIYAGWDELLRNGDAVLVRVSLVDAAVVTLGQQAS
jgi:hypothetical protein